MLIICYTCRWQGTFEETNAGFCPMCSQKLDLPRIDLSEYF